jgi:hypothetical protein
MNRDGHEVLFEEEQRFRQWWMWGIVGVCFLIPLSRFGYGIWQQIILGKPWGNRPISDAALLLIASAVVGVEAVLFALFWLLKLAVRVDSGCLHVRFWPFVNRHIPLEDIASWEARTYRPILEYGGWGIRYTFRSGKAYNVSGDEGVQLVFANGKRLLIGSQRADELADAIARAKQEIGDCQQTR